MAAPVTRVASALAALVFAGAAPAGKEALTLTSPASRTTLLELFTSEGCSSCPPAEEWLSGLRSDPRLWKEVVPVAFHVDYWDYIGWKDPLADARFTARQRAYARRWEGGGGMYTPGFVLDGREWKEWFSAPELPAPIGEAAGALTAKAAGPRRFEVDFVPVADGGAWEAHAALLGMGIVIDVNAGENRGRRLRHDFAALSTASVPLKDEGGRHTAALELPEPTLKAPSRALAVWVTRAGSNVPVQAAGTFLP